MIDLPIIDLFDDSLYLIWLEGARNYVDHTF